jgi:RNA polymerase sigma factor (sigma-70 family)
VEVSALHHRGPALRGSTPLLRLQGDERLVALTRRGNQAAYETLVARYEPRLLAFCRHMVRSREDAEDVLQEVFAAAFNAMLTDNRPINVRPWLYRIARNRCLNHLRRTQPIGVDSMDIHLADNGASTADVVHEREEFRLLIADVQKLAETQRTALLLREIDALSYDQIAEAMETTIPAVKSLLVRARVGLAEATEARRLSCDEVRMELGEVAEGLKRRSAAVRRHTRDCERCGDFEKDIQHTSKALASIFPVGPLLILKNYLVAHGASQAAAGGATAGVGAAAAGAGTGGAGSAITVGLGAVAAKATAGLAAAALVTAGAVEVDHRTAPKAHHRAVVAHKLAPAAAAKPRVLVATPQPEHLTKALATPATATEVEQVKPAIAPAETAGEKRKVTASTAVAPVAPVQTGSDTTTLPPDPATAAQSGGLVAVTGPQQDPAPSSTTTGSTPSPAPSSGQPTPSPSPAQTTPAAAPLITIALPRIHLPHIGLLPRLHGLRRGR